MTKDPEGAERRGGSDQPREGRYVAAECFEEQVDVTRGVALKEERQPPVTQHSEGAGFAPASQLR
jgi:hypothetical protein